MQIGIFLRVNVGLINHKINASAYIDVFLFPMYLYGSMPGLVWVKSSCLLACISTLSMRPLLGTPKLLLNYDFSWFLSCQSLKSLGSMKGGRTRTLMLIL